MAKSVQNYLTLRHVLLVGSSHNLRIFERSRQYGTSCKQRGIKSSLSNGFSGRCCLVRPVDNSMQPLFTVTRSQSSFTKDPVGSSPIDTFLQSSSADFIDDIYLQWKSSPESVHESWQDYFSDVEQPTVEGKSGREMLPNKTTSSLLSPSTQLDSETDIELIDHLNLQSLIRAYQTLGHQKAEIDPLGLRGVCDGAFRKAPPELALEYHGFSVTDLTRYFRLPPGVLDGFVATGSRKLKLENIISACEHSYCGSYTVQYDHIADEGKRKWVRERFENPNLVSYSIEEKRRILDRMIWSSTFEKFLATKFPMKKRYGLEGGESFTVGYKALIDRSADHGVEDIVIASQHRGRVSVLCNVLRRPAHQMIYEFSSRVRAASQAQSGDTKEHMGTDYTRTTPSGRKVNLSLLANPSHLESEDPVAAGKARALHHFKGDRDWTKTMCLAIHGDAALPGQGIIYETFTLSNLAGYTTGGTIHIAMNNQIGFTTDPSSSRSTPYCTDLAKAFDCPIFHVNGDDVEAVNRIFEIAADWRAMFHTDCVVDFVCYRKYGHNEMDQPLFTQPLMYQRIAKKRPVMDIYADELVESGTFSREYVSQEHDKIWSHFEKSFQDSQLYEPTHAGTGKSKVGWEDMISPDELSAQVFETRPTAVTDYAIEAIAASFQAIPLDFQLHRNVEKILHARYESLMQSKVVDWSTAEALAFGTLCLDGYHVRVSGQDVQRGTFSQRHAVMRNQLADIATVTDVKSSWIALDNISPDQGRFVITNSPLSEFSVLGFEYGYSLASSKAFVMWEAQFGDFANNAQVIIDQFIAPGEAKWLQQSGLVLSLPHGYDGQGPEHSSSRLERFLQLCNGDARDFPCANQHAKAHQLCNIQVANVTTPANLFHILRRQMLRPYRKPLILPFSKSLLRHSLTKSPISDFLGDSRFLPVIRDTELGKDIAAPDQIRRVILCSGQVYAKLYKHRMHHGVKHTAVIRIEELHPFPWLELRDELESFPNADQIQWCQEEPMNAGPWSYVSPRLDVVLTETRCHANKRAKYTGRPPSSSTATGYKIVHDAEEERLMQMAFSNKQ